MHLCFSGHLFYILWIFICSSWLFYMFHEWKPNSIQYTYRIECALLLLNQLIDSIWSTFEKLTAFIDTDRDDRHFCTFKIFDKIHQHLMKLAMFCWSAGPSVTAHVCHFPFLICICCTWTSSHRTVSKNIWYLVFPLCWLVNMNMNAAYIRLDTDFWSHALKLLVKH